MPRKQRSRTALPSSASIPQGRTSSAASRNLGFFAYRQNLVEFQLAAKGQHINDATRFETVMTGLQAIKFEQVPPELAKAFINIWSQTRRAQKICQKLPEPGLHAQPPLTLPRRE
jgi:hypothetical protein